MPLSQFLDKDASLTDLIYKPQFYKSAENKRAIDSFERSSTDRA